MIARWPTSTVTKFAFLSMLACTIFHRFSPSRYTDSWGNFEGRVRLRQKTEVWKVGFYIEQWNYCTVYGKRTDTQRVRQNISYLVSSTFDDNHDRWPIFVGYTPMQYAVINKIHGSIMSHFYFPEHQNLRINLHRGSSFCHFLVSGELHPADPNRYWSFIIIYLRTLVIRNTNKINM